MYKLEKTYNFVMIILGLGFLFSVCMFIIESWENGKTESQGEISKITKQTQETEEDTTEIENSINLEEDIVFAFSDNRERNMFHLITYDLSENASKEAYIPTIPAGTKLVQKKDSIQFYKDQPITIIELQNKDEEEIQYWYQYAYEQDKWTKIYESKNGITKWKLNETFDQLILYKLNTIYTLPVKQNNTVEPKKIAEIETETDLHTFDQSTNSVLTIHTEKQNTTNIHTLQSLNLQTGESVEKAKIITENEEIIGKNFSEHLSENGQYYTFWKETELNLYNTITQETHIITTQKPLIPNILWSKNSQKFAFLPDDQGIWIHNTLTDKKAKILKQAPQEFVLWAHNQYIIHAQNDTLYSLNTLTGENILIKGEEKLYQRLLGINE